MKGIIVSALFVIAVVCCTDGAPVETEVAASASTAKQPQISPATTVFANPSASAKSSISDHPRHKRRRHHRRRHKLHRHRHKLYPLKDRLQKFVGGSSETASNLLASVKNPRQDFEMTNGEVFEHGGVPDLKSVVPVRRATKNTPHVSTGTPMHRLNETEGGPVVALSGEADINSQLENLTEGSGEEDGSSDDDDIDVGDVLYADNSTLVLIHDFGKDNKTDSTLRKLLKNIPSVINDTGDGLYNSNSLKSDRQSLINAISNKQLTRMPKKGIVTNTATTEHILKSVSKFPPIKVHSNVGDFMMPDLHDIFHARNNSKNSTIDQSHKKCLNATNVNNNSTQQRDDILIRCGEFQPVSSEYTFETVGSDMVDNPTEFDNGSTWHNFEDVKTTWKGSEKEKKEDSSAIKGEDELSQATGNSTDVEEKDISLSKGDATEKADSKDTSHENSQVNLNVTEKGSLKDGSNKGDHILPDKETPSDSSKDYNEQNLPTAENPQSSENSTGANETLSGTDSTKDASSSSIIKDDDHLNLDVTSKEAPGNNHSLFDSKNNDETVSVSAAHSNLHIKNKPLPKYSVDDIHGYLIFPDRKDEKSSKTSAIGKDYLNLDVKDIEQINKANEHENSTSKDTVSTGANKTQSLAMDDNTNKSIAEEMSSNNTLLSSENSAENKTDLSSNKTNFMTEEPVVNERLPFSLPVISVMLPLEAERKLMTGDKFRHNNQHNIHKKHRHESYENNNYKDDGDNYNEDENDHKPSFNSYHGSNHPADDYANEDALYDDEPEGHDGIGREESVLTQKSLALENPNLTGQIHEQSYDHERDDDDRGDQFGDYAECNGVPYGCHRYFQYNHTLDFLPN